MNVSVSLDLDLPFFKDLWGYKQSTPVPGMRYGNIEFAVNCGGLPTSVEEFTSEDSRFYKLVNNEAVTYPVRFAVKGVSAKVLFGAPGALALIVGQAVYHIELELLEFKPSTFRWSWETTETGTAMCKIRITDTIKKYTVADEDIVRFYNVPFWTLGMLKTYLSAPESYYVSFDGSFFTPKPHTFSHYERIYKAETPLKDIKCPTIREITMDPLLYTDHQFKPAEWLAKALVSGCL